MNTYYDYSNQTKKTLKTNERSLSRKERRELAKLEERERRLYDKKQREIAKRLGFIK
ncbi:hypothetical protein AR9_g159 [Bacillus phage AR9]|uniref:Uncharacterized protein n=2 Tax=Bacillus phage PBS1 TaxID=10683 RepID=A0A172JI66_BPPB1|nr:hypothetical protein BI022_gp158 [Bacillus phage AR9]YP_009664249.1 hypothetical protein FK780_gp047 [Bacillus phage PBS1]QXN70082.1 hypothetical protein INTERNEXUS_41 [Bacillus phage vB_BspM_Internexus]WCS68282.1 hypothetical protein Goe21_01720 [Bacillus phage vB_BsuM-Goe21]AMS01243.1 hypothetical protein AR9_g159 [Bacillus phage AR9]AST99869.1 hypothetical protein PBI_PBS1_47 [Bacillus phage PBS1]BDE75311.1 hypothetical protein [Bacillus phage PBS1]